MNAALPPGATPAEDGWNEDPTGLPSRVLDAAPRSLPGVTVHAAVVQLGDGTLTEPTITVGGADAGLTPVQARALAAQLVAAADELDSWATP